MMRDLFGNEVVLRNNLEDELGDYDRLTFKARLDRLRYLHQVYHLAME